MMGFLRYLLLLGFATSAMAQGRDDGSLYSRYGVGELRSFASSKVQAMGGGGTAMWSFNYTNFGNPAAWSRQVLVRASAAMRFDGIRSHDAANNGKELLTGSFSALQFGVPLWAGRVGMGFSFDPYSRVNYEVTTHGDLQTDPGNEEPTPYRINYEGSGGLQLLRAGVGVRPASWFSLGMSADFIFGITEESRRTTFDSVILAETNLATSTRLHGVTATGGAIVSVSTPLSSGDELTVGGSVTLPTTLSGNRARTLGESLNRDTLGAQITGNMTLPVSARAGVAYYMQNRWTFTADARYEPWTNFESNLAVPGYTPGGINNMRDRIRYSGGIEVLPAGASVQEPYYARVAYRIGYYHDESYVSPISGANITTEAFTGGLSLPALFAGTRLDLTFEVGSRGSQTGVLVRDRFVSVSATLNVGERWFVKRKLR